MSNVELVQTALAAVREGNVERAREIVADDFVWHIPGTSPISGDAAGPDGWAQKLGQLLAAGLKPEVQAMLEGADHVAVLQRNTASIRRHTLDVRVINLFTVHEGKVARLDTFFGDQAAADAFWQGALGD